MGHNEPIRTESAPIADRAPSLRLFVIGALAWGALMAISAIFTLYRRNGLQTDSLADLIVLYFLGGACAWPIALSAAHSAARGKPIETRFAACMLFLSLNTMMATALLFALDYRLFYSRWHAPFGTITWMFQFVFTGASAVFQFGVLGSRLFLPFGLLWLPAASFYLARRMR